LSGNPGKHASFHHAKEKSCGVEAFFVLNGCVAGKDNSPGEDDSELPIARTYLFEEKITWDLKDNVTDLMKISK